MMLFGLFFSLSLCLIVFYSCRPTAAAAVAISPVKRGRLIDPIECPRPVPLYIPPDFPRFPTLLDMCASRAGHPRNLECICAGSWLICGAARRAVVRQLINYCFSNCVCGEETKIVRDDFTKKLNHPAIVSFAGPRNVGNDVSNPSTNPPTLPGGSSSWTNNIPTSARDMRQRQSRMPLGV